LQQWYNGPGRRRTYIRRGAPRPPRRKKAKKRTLGGSARKAPGAAGFESFLTVSAAEAHFFQETLSSSGDVSAAPTSLERRNAIRRRREGFLFSVVFHLLIALILILEPQFLNIGERQSDEAALAEKPDRLVLFMDEPEPEVTPPTVSPPEALLLMEEPPEERLIIPKALRPPPPDKQQEFMNDLPFSEGNTDEFVTDEETEDPGEEGEPGDPEEPDREADLASKESGEGENNPAADSEASKLADLLPRDSKLAFLDPDMQRPVTPNQPGNSRTARPEPPPSRSGEAGQGGEGGAFEDIRRFLAGSRFDNPEGGLVTGKSNTLYYNDKGANFVPWLRRMLAEVRRNWIPPYSASFLAGHVAVGISVVRSGEIAELDVLIPSGTVGFDNAAVGALRAADLLPLPGDYPDDRFDIIIVFWYNERPYDLF
jgi:TonB family protein